MRESKTWKKKSLTIKSQEGAKQVDKLFGAIFIVEKEMKRKKKKEGENR